MTFSVGDFVVNLTSEVAEVVAIHSHGPVLHAINWDLTRKRGRNHKWIASEALTRKLTDAEVIAFNRKGRIFR